jgi:hypothetical protein
MGMDIFKRPAITKVFHPVVGKGAVYQDTGKDARSKTTEISIVGKEMTDGKEGFWMQFVSSDPDGKTIVGKTLITPDDFQYHRMVVQPPGQQAMEMPMHMNPTRNQKMEESMNDWHSIGTETITVPAGSFSCEHWRNDKNHSDVWTSEKITPFGMVKSVSANGDAMVLEKVLDNATDRITGPVKQFDMQEMMQQMQQRHQQSPQR